MSQSSFGASWVPLPYNRRDLPSVYALKEIEW
jgi:hypothetical protein